MGWNSFFFSLKLFLKSCLYFAALSSRSWQINVNGLGQRSRVRSELGRLWRESKHHLQLHPHAADAAVGEVAIQETAWWCAEHISLRRVHKLRMIEGIQRFPAELQPLRLSNGNRLGQV